MYVANIFVGKKLRSEKLVTAKKNTHTHRTRQKSVKLIRRIKTLNTALKIEKSTVP